MKLLVNKLFGKFAIFAIIIFTSMSIASAKVKVVSTFSILGDMVQNIGGNNIELTTLVGQMVMVMSMSLHLRMQNL